MPMDVQRTTTGQQVNTQSFNRFNPSASIPFPLSLTHYLFGGLTTPTKWHVCISCGDSDGGGDSPICLSSPSAG